MAAARAVGGAARSSQAGRRAVLCMVSMKAAARLPLAAWVARFLAFAAVLAAMPATNTRRMSSSDRLHDSLRLSELKISIWLELDSISLSSRPGLEPRLRAVRAPRRSNEPQLGAR